MPRVGLAEQLPISSFANPFCPKYVVHSNLQNSYYKPSTVFSFFCKHAIIFSALLLLQGLSRKNE